MNNDKDFNNISVEDIERMQYEEGKSPSDRSGNMSEEEDGIQSLFPEKDGEIPGNTPSVSEKDLKDDGKIHTSRVDGSQLTADELLEMGRKNTEASMPGAPTESKETPKPKIWKELTEEEKNARLDKLFAFIDSKDNSMLLDENYNLVPRDGYVEKHPRESVWKGATPKEGATLEVDPGQGLKDADRFGTSNVTRTQFGGYTRVTVQSGKDAGKEYWLNDKDEKVDAPKSMRMMALMNQGVRTSGASDWDALLKAQQDADASDVKGDFKDMFDSIRNAQTKSLEKKRKSKALFRQSIGTTMQAALSFLNDDIAKGTAKIHNVKVYDGDGGTMDRAYAMAALDKDAIGEANRHVIGYGGKNRIEKVVVMVPVSSDGKPIEGAQPKFRLVWGRDGNRVKNGTKVEQFNEDVDFATYQKRMEDAYNALLGNDSEAAQNAAITATGSNPFGRQTKQVEAERTERMNQQKAEATAALERQKQDGRVEITNIKEEGKNKRSDDRIAQKHDELVRREERFVKDYTLKISKAKSEQEKSALKNISEQHKNVVDEYNSLLKQRDGAGVTKTQRDEIDEKLEELQSKMSEIYDKYNNSQKLTSNAYVSIFTNNDGSPTANLEESVKEAKKETGKEKPSQNQSEHPEFDDKKRYNEGDIFSRKGKLYRMEKKDGKLKPVRYNKEG